MKEVAVTSSRFAIEDKFYLNGKPFQIISGAIHYFRVVAPYWRDRLEKLRAMGCNTVETYVPWNLHEPQRGRFCFDGMLDLAGFLETAAELGLKAIVRPSPYICGEWEFGGLPAWLLAEDGMRLRSTYPPFLDAIRTFYTHLMEILTPLQIDRGGPVILMQVENEYGAFGDETAYLEELRASMRKCGVTVPLITSDGPWNDYLNNGRLDGALMTANFGSKAERQFSVLRQHMPKGPLMCTEFWVGWFDAWGDKEHHTTSADQCAAELDAILSQGSVNIYMFHGGTNFGFMNGANDYGSLAPDVTSYDYDAPLSEDGRITPKYLAMREVIRRYRDIPPTDLMESLPRRGYGVQKVEARVSLFSTLDGMPRTQSPWPLCMEKLGQSYGYTLYSTTLRPGYKLEDIQLIGANDRVQIFLDGVFFKTLYDRELLAKCVIPSERAACSHIDLLVENMGRVNYGHKMDCQRKGIDGAVLVNGHAHAGWSMIPLWADASQPQPDFSANYRPDMPGFYRFAFFVDSPADTFLDMDGWGKGCVFLNGFNLGRFWEIGPQKRLYVPAPLLRTGRNELLVFESEGKANDSVGFFDTPDLG